MELIIAILFGVVQGLTEFIPVSSSGHLILLHEVFPNFGSGDAIAFDVALHVGTLLALFGVFWADIIRYIRAFFRRPRSTADQQDRRVSWMIIAAIIPAGAVGFFFEDMIETYLRSSWVVVGMLISVGLLFILVEQIYTKQMQHRQINEMTLGTALVVGFMQVIALVPGTSRSGITIIAGMLAGLSRDAAARFSFLISIPLVAGAGLKKFVDLAILGISGAEIPLILIGMVSSAIVGYIAIRELLKYLGSRSLIPFAVYRLALAAIVIGITLF